MPDDKDLMRVDLEAWKGLEEALQDYLRRMEAEAAVAKIVAGLVLAGIPWGIIATIDRDQSLAILACATLAIAFIVRMAQGWIARRFYLDELGIARNFVHLDRDISRILPRPMRWRYRSK